MLGLGRVEKQGAAGAPRAAVPRVVILCSLSHDALSVFSRRNHGMGDTSIKFEVVPGKNQKSEYVMACGKHTVRGWCKDSAPCPCSPHFPLAPELQQCGLAVPIWHDWGRPRPLQLEGGNGQPMGERPQREVLLSGLAGAPSPGH